MTAPLWVTELAADFWQMAGGPEPFPRALRGPLARAGFELTVRDTPGLSVGAVERYLADLGSAWTCGAPDRPLRACLAAVAGAGFIFIEEADPCEERAFSLGHELAHFLRDYWQPRRRAAAALGDAVLDVLDGRRPPRPEERLHGLLRGVPVGLHVHLMARDRPRPAPAVAAAEVAADRLACELLAPEAEVRARLPARASAGTAAHLLRADFGLPPAVAAAYAAALRPPPAPPDPLAARLKKARAARRTSATGPEQESGGADERRP